MAVSVLEFITVLPHYLIARHRRRREMDLHEFVHEIASATVKDKTATKRELLRTLKTVMILTSYNH